jgi:DNA-binding MarR family transcriptional regulator
MDEIKVKLMHSLAELDQHVWQREPLFAGTVGRHVYMCLAKELIDLENSLLDRSLKQIFQHPYLTDRAVRLKLRELEQHGFIEMDASLADRRTRSFKPTSKLMGLYEEHAERGMEILASNFYLIERLEDKRLKVKQA